MFTVEDGEVIQAFVDGGARRAFGPTLHIEGDVLFFDGWWQAALRLGPTAFAIRGEEPPDGTEVRQRVADALRANGLQALGTEFPLIGAFTYAEIECARAFGPPPASPAGRKGERDAGGEERDFGER